MSVSYYQRLGVAPHAPVSDIRQAYRQLSKRYHPDTSPLRPEVAIRCFQEIQEAYAVLSNPAQRAAYDASLWLQDPQAVWNNRGAAPPESPLELRMETRPLSAGEVAVLLLMVLTFGACLLLAVGIAWMRQHP